MITKAEWDAMDDRQRWDLFNAMQWEVAQADNAVDAGDDDEDMTYERSRRIVPDERPKPYESGRAHST